MFVLSIILNLGIWILSFESDVIHSAWCVETCSQDQKSAETNQEGGKGGQSMRKIKDTTQVQGQKKIEYCEVQELIGGGEK